MWLNILSAGIKAGGHIYRQKDKKQKWQWQMHNIRTAMAMAKGEKEYEGKLLEARQSDWKDEFVLLILSAPILC